METNYLHIIFGSSNIKRIESGYRGSVSSRQWKEIWKKELKENPQLFTIEILSTFANRKEALAEENRLHHELNVVQSDFFINKSYACINGFFGAKLIPWNKGKKIPYRPSNRDFNGQKNSFYGRHHSKETKEKLRNKLKGRTKETHEYLRINGENRKKLNKHNCEGIKRQSEAVTIFTDDHKQNIVNLYNQLKSFKLVYEKLNNDGIKIAYTTVVKLYNDFTNNYTRKNEPLKSNDVKVFIKTNLLEGKTVKYIKNELFVQFNIDVTEQQIDLFKHRNCSPEEKQIIKNWRLYVLTEEERIDVVLRHNSGEQLKQIWKEYKGKYPELKYNKIFKIWTDFKLNGENNESNYTN